MGKRERKIREREYDEMERASMTASFRNPPYYLTAAGMGRKEKKDGTGKEKDGRTDVKKLGRGG